MSINFDVNAATAYASFTAGSAAAAGTGPRTVAALVRPQSGNNNAGFAAAMASSTIIFEIFEDTLLLFGEGDFSSGFGPGGGNMTQDTWYVVALTHPGSSAPWRMHIWPYAADGSGIMSHGVSTGAGNHTNTGSAATELRIGAVDVKGNGDIAVAAFWTRECSDEDLDGLKSNLLTAWSGLANGGPAELIHFQGWNGTTGATIAVGTSAFSSLTGTSTAGGEPPSFNYALTAAPVTGFQRFPPAPLFSALAAATEAKWRAGSSVTTVTATGSGTSNAHPTTGAAGAKTATGTGTAIAHPAGSATGAKTATGAGTGGARAVVAATGLKVASDVAAAVGHAVTAGTGSKTAGDAGTAAAHPATTAAGQKTATGTGTAVAYAQALAVKVGVTASGAGTATSRVAVAATGLKVAIVTAVAVAHPVTASAGQKTATAATGAQAHVSTAATGQKAGIGAAAPRACTGTATTGQKAGSGAGSTLARPHVATAGSKAVGAGASAVARAVTLAGSPPTAVPPSTSLVHVRPAPLLHVAAAPLVHIGSG